MNKRAKNFYQRVLTSKTVHLKANHSMIARTHLLVFALVVASSLGAKNLNASDQIPGKPQDKPIAIVGATLHPVSSEPIENATIVFEDGKIKAIGTSVTLPGDCEIVEGRGKHVYPSIIEPYSDIGLVEINSVPASVDSREIGEFNSNVRAEAAFNPDSELIPVNRANGILIAATAPSGRRVAGRSSLMMLDGWTAEDMVLKQDLGMHVSWTSDEEALEELEVFFAQARRYMETPESDRTRDLRLDAMTKVLDGSMPLIASANSVDWIRSAVAFAKRHEIKLIILGGSDAMKCAELLIEEKVPVIVSSVYRSPRRRHAAYDEPYSLPMQLEEAGVEFCISAGGRFGASGIRNLPYHAATAAAYGLGEKVALEALTLRTAKILGVANRVGSLEVGKDATLFVADGNILETPTQVEAAYVQGRVVDLDNKHRQLYRKYSAKYAD